MGGGVKLASGGTDNHLMLCDVVSLGLTGKIAEIALDKARISGEQHDSLRPAETTGSERDPIRNSVLSNAQA